MASEKFLEKFLIDTQILPSDPIVKVHQSMLKARIKYTCKVQGGWNSTPVFDQRFHLFPTR